jgi:hypothetical protein
VKNRPKKINDAEFCIPIAMESSLRKRSSLCADVMCMSRQCQPPENTPEMVLNFECDSCDEQRNLIDGEEESDDSSLEETMEIINEVINNKEPGPTKPALRTVLPKQESKKASGQVKDASALKSFAYGKK